MIKITLVALLGFTWSTQALANGVEVTESGKPPARKVAVVSPGVYKAVVWQESGGGIMEFYDLVQDPEGKWNLAGWDRGLVEVGWHGAQFQSPTNKKDCCVKHMLAKNREGPCYDLIDGVDHLVKMGLVDKKKVGITGGSYGGYATAWGATYYSHRFAAGVMFVGISDWMSCSGTTDIPQEMFLVHHRKWLWDDWDYFKKASPLNYLDKAKTPLLIMHGKADPRVNPRSIAGIVPPPQGPQPSPGPPRPLSRRRARQPPGGVPPRLQHPPPTVDGALPQRPRWPHAAQGHRLRPDAAGTASGELCVQSASNLLRPGRPATSRKVAHES
jgi:hypothetical protein